MRSRWYHAPTFHYAARGSRAVSWLEMLFDLIYVAALTQVAWGLPRALETGEVLWGFALFLAHLVPVTTAWLGSAFHTNRFDVDDVLHRVVALVQMLGLWAVGLTAPLSLDGDHLPFALAMGATNGMFAVSAVLWTASAFASPMVTLGLGSAASLVLLVSPFLPSSRQLSELNPPDLDHMSQRHGVLVLMALGASTVLVLSSLTTTEQEALPMYLVMGSTCLTIATSVWWIYFDDVAGSTIRVQRGAWLVWLYGHIPIIAGIVSLSPALRAVMQYDPFATAPQAWRSQLSMALAMVLGAVALVDAVTERRQNELSDSARVNVRAFTAVTVVLMGQVGDLSVTTFSFLLVGACVVQVLFDMAMAPFEEAAEDLGATPTADLARAARDRGEASSLRIRTDVDRVIRRGRPNDLNNDLYVFFMEGSWTRTILLLGVGFVGLNVLFASLYLLEDGAISGADDASFLDAFSFSVQTMSTIGYGALSPATPYGDLISAIEAAVGLFVVALATGLMFAKASRPQAHVLFSHNLIVVRWDGVPTLSFRAANARSAEIVDASLSFTVLLDEVTEEGHHLRRLHDLKLRRDRSPLFSMTWTVQHPIDETSPLYDLDLSDPAVREGLFFVVTLVGHDSAYGQTAHSRHLYSGTDMLLGRRFADVVSQMPDGRLVLDYEHFHDTVPDADPFASNASAG
jgi:inward rectifier potassium channel